MEIKTMGSIYFNGAAMEPDFNCDSSPAISFGYASPGKELRWVDVGDKLVADRCVCIGISWANLNRLGFVFGHPIRIKDKFYLCRCLQMGSLEYEATQKNIGIAWLMAARSMLAQTCILIYGNLPRCTTERRTSQATVGLYPLPFS